MASATKQLAIPYSEPSFHYSPSPYYKQTHYEWQKKVRAFVEKEMMPFVDKWEAKGDFPSDLHEKAYKAGIYGAMYPAEYGGTPPKDCDPFHDLIMIDELSRTGCGGVLWSCFYSFGIALPPIFECGSQYLKDRVLRNVITGKKIMSLAITEPGAGSDVAAIQTTATLTDDGSHYIVNGEKYFITAGMKAEYFTTAVRCVDAQGNTSKRISLMVIERGMKGVYTSRMKTQGWLTSTTAYVIFKNVRVPKSHIIGKEGMGFKPLMHNFNHERFIFAAMANRYARVCLEEAIKYAKERKTFGKPLIKHQVIRHKIGNMIKRVESTQAFIEQVCYQMKLQGCGSVLGGRMALLKVAATECMEYCAREATQIFGGRGYIRGSRASKVERLYREVRAMAIAGGSEEILIDLAVRQAKL